MADIANMTLVGRLTRDPEARFTPNARMNVQFSIAVNRRRSEGTEPSAMFFRVTAWGGLAETLDRLATNGAFIKGREVFVSGRFETREYQDQQGQTRLSLDINADTVQLTGPNPNAGTEPPF